MRAGEAVAGGRLHTGKVREWLESVTDPEIPVLTIADLGILRDVRIAEDRVEVVITPTYSGCPAMGTIEDDIRAVLARHGVTGVQVTHRVSPPWTTDWLSEAGRRKLADFGIAPPVGRACDRRALRHSDPCVRCPQCGSRDTRRVSEFGSTACKALYCCNDCLEPFDYFKCI